jgi:hypothetical protein
MSEARLTVVQLLPALEAGGAERSALASVEAQEQAQLDASQASSEAADRLAARANRLGGRRMNMGDSVEGEADCNGGWRGVYSSGDGRERRVRRGRP